MMTLILIALLGHPSCEVRQSAESSLGLIPSALPALQSALDLTADPEVSLRLARVLTRLAVEQDGNALWLGSFVGLPYADSLPGCSTYLWEARQQMQGRNIALPAGLWLEYRLATRIMLDRQGPDLLALGLMQARSRHWDCFGRYP